MTASARYVEYAKQGMTPKQVQAMTGSRRRSVRHELSRAHDELSANAEAAVALLERSSLLKSVTEGDGGRALSKRRWEDVALGLVPASKLAA